MDIYTVIVRPLVTEKTEEQKEEGKYSFKVHSRANKNEIKRAVEGIYDVDSHCAPPGLEEGNRHSSARSAD
jgi:ribosomal protein L23